MAIDRLNLNVGTGVNRAQEPGDSRNPAARTELESNPATDRVELSGDARLIAGLEEQAQALPEIRQELVDAIRRDLASGAHRVDPRQLARLILEFEDALAG